MKVKGICKKICASVCASAMVFGLVVTSGMSVKAEGSTATPTPTSTPVPTINTKAKGSLTIEKYLGPAGDISTPLKGAEFTIVRVCDINQVQDNTGNVGNSSLNYTLPADVYKTLFGEGDVAVKTSDEINKALTDKLGAKTNTATKNALEDYVTKATDTKSSVTTGEKGTATASELAVGLYLVVETKVPENVYSTTDPFFVSIPMTDGSGWTYDITVEPKNQNSNPTIDKKVKDNGDSDYADTTSVSMGDTVSYQITSQLPLITSEATYLTTYTFVDTLANGLSYVEDTDSAQNVTITFNDGTDGAVGTTWKTNTDLDNTAGTQAPFKVEYDDTNNKMTIAFTAEGLAKINTTMSGKTMTITYTATVDNASNDHAVMGDGGNENDVTLTFKRTNTTEFETLEDKAIVYTYGIDLTKKLQGSDKSYSSVKFKLSTSNGQSIKVVGSNGVYYVSSAAEAVDEFSVGDNGTLKIYGLEADTYSLTETATASGYSLLKQPITVVITPSSKTITAASLDDKAGKNVMSEGAITTAKATVDNNSVDMKADSDSSNALVPITVTNTKSFTLPTTGGVGVMVCTMLGAIVFAGAVIFLRRKA